MNSPFNNFILCDSFFGGLECEWPEALPNNIVTMGSGPFDEDDFDHFLIEKEVKVNLAGTDLNILVIGWNNWDEEELDKHLELRRGKELRVYSQEMLLTYLCSYDPYNWKDELDANVLDIFGEGHPALEWLMEWGFDWPRTTIVPSSGGRLVDPEEWPEIGPLGYLGYKVGRNGVGRNKRHQILRDVFVGRLPHINSDSYMEKWGEPGSKTRLCEIAESIASFTRNAKKRGNPPKKAISDWEEDLDWLKKKLYHGRFRFSWPDTTVR